jgi:hypothetical protein
VSRRFGLHDAVGPHQIGHMIESSQLNRWNSCLFNFFCDGCPAARAGSSGRGENNTCDTIF